MLKTKLAPPSSNRLRVLRAEHYVTQRQVAQHLGMSQSRYWELESGYREATPEQRKALSALFDVRQADIFPAKVA